VKNNLKGFPLKPLAPIFRESLNGSFDFINLNLLLSLALFLIA